MRVLIASGGTCVQSRRGFHAIMALAPNCVSEGKIHHTLPDLAFAHVNGFGFSHSSLGHL
eukprot:107111-Amphidinium_carterae.1